MAPVYEGYLRVLKTGVTKAVKEVFGPNYPETTLQNLHASVEFPVKQQEYPSIWVDVDISTIQNAGIDHYELDEDYNKTLRWRFEGHTTYTIVAMTSLERDRIYDEMVKVLAFGPASESAVRFREFIEDNEFIAVNFDLDQLDTSIPPPVPGTPWETDEIIYEATITVQMLGEFTTHVDTGNLMPLSKVLIDGRVTPSEETDPKSPLHWEVPNPEYTPGEWI
jgi:hypothetical protein